MSITLTYLIRLKVFLCLIYACIINWGGDYARMWHQPPILLCTISQAELLQFSRNKIVKEEEEEAKYIVRVIVYDVVHAHRPNWINLTFLNSALVHYARVTSIVGTGEYEVLFNLSKTETNATNIKLRRWNKMQMINNLLIQNACTTDYTNNSHIWRTLTQFIVLSEGWDWLRQLNWLLKKMLISCCKA